MHVRKIVHAFLTLTISLSLALSFGVFVAATSYTALAASTNSNSNTSNTASTNSTVTNTNTATTKTEPVTLPDTVAFRRGDANADGRVDLSDGITINEVVAGRKTITCQDAADVNNDGSISIADSAALLAYLFEGGAAPTLPGPQTPGLDIGADMLGCESYNVGLLTIAVAEARDISDHGALVYWQSETGSQGEYRYAANTQELAQKSWSDLGVANGPDTGNFYGSKVLLSSLNAGTTYYVELRKWVGSGSTTGPAKIYGPSKTLSFTTLRTSGSVNTNASANANSNVSTNVNANPVTTPVANLGGPAIIGRVVRLAGSEDRELNEFWYYVGSNNKRYVFATKFDGAAETVATYVYDTFATWYASADDVLTISRAQLESTALAANVTMRPGSRLVGISTDPRVYVIGGRGLLQSISETAVIRLYGPNWKSQYFTYVPDHYFVNYVMGVEYPGTRHPDGTLIQYPGQSSVYLIDEGQRRLIVGSLGTYGYRTRDVVTVSADLVYPEGKPLEHREARLHTPAGPIGVDSLPPLSFHREDSNTQALPRKEAPSVELPKPGLPSLVVPSTVTFRRGDVNGNGKVDISDAISLNNAIGKPTGLGCADAADINDDGSLSINDSLTLLSYLFEGGAAPAAPGPLVPGVDPTDDTLGCQAYGGVTSSRSEADTDRDGLVDFEERLRGTNVTLADTDADGFSDADEVRNGYNPLVAGSAVVGTAAQRAGFYGKTRLSNTKLEAAETAKLRTEVAKILNRPVSSIRLHPSLVNARLYGGYRAEEIALVVKNGPAKAPLINPKIDASAWRTTGTYQKAAPQFLATFTRGDINGDGAVDISDISVLGSYFSGKAKIACLDAADVNDDGRVDTADLKRLTDYYSNGGAAPADPGPGSAGADPTPDALFCAR